MVASITRNVGWCNKAKLRNFGASTVFTHTQDRKFQIVVSFYGASTIFILIAVPVLRITTPTSRLFNARKTVYSTSRNSSLSYSTFLWILIPNVRS